MSVVCVCWTDAAINDISFKNIFHLLQKSSWRCLTCFSLVNPQRLPWPSVDRALLATFDVEVVVLAIHSELVEAPALSAMWNMPESFSLSLSHTKTLYKTCIYIIHIYVIPENPGWLLAVSTTVWAALLPIIAGRIIYHLYLININSETCCGSIAWFLLWTCTKALLLEGCWMCQYVYIYVYIIYSTYYI